MKNTFKYFLCVLLACSGMFMLTSCEKSATEQLKDDVKKVQKDASKAADKAAKDADKAAKDAGLK